MENRIKNQHLVLFANPASSSHFDANQLPLTLIRLAYTLIEEKRQASYQGHAVVQYMLGETYAFGNGVPVDQALTYAWLNLSAAQGNRPAANSRDFLGKSMTVGQLAEAQRIGRALAGQISTN